MLSAASCVLMSAVGFDGRGPVWVGKASRKRSYLS